TLVKHLVKWVALTESEAKAQATLLDIVDTPISPELLPPTEDGQIAQKTEDNVGPYELHDFFIYYFMRYGFRPAKIFAMASKAFEGVYNEDIIKKWLRTFCWRFFSQQFKRSCMPDGPKVGSVTLSPRGDWRMPSDASSELWIEECQNL
ncbi:MAG: NAD(+) synthase, partial [Bacteroidaceae bacterium]|nr:NAD(+) synthase [Bacteroidaceae bacterium]